MLGSVHASGPACLARCMHLALHAWLGASRHLSCSRALLRQRASLEASSMSDAIKRPRGAIQSVRVPLSRPSLCDELSYLLMPWLVLVLDACVDTSMMQMTSPHPDGNPQRRDGPPRAAAQKRCAATGVSQSTMCLQVGRARAYCGCGYGLFDEHGCVSQEWTQCRISLHT